MNALEIRPRATLADWRSPPANRWAFHHVRELIPTADIPNDSGRERELDVEPSAFDTAFESPQAEPDSGETLTLDAFLRDFVTDCFVIVHRGRIVFEFYRTGMRLQMPHILMLVSK